MASLFKIALVAIFLTHGFLCYAADTLTIGPVPTSFVINGVSVPLRVTGALRAETLADRVAASLRLTLPLDELAARAPAIAVAAGLVKGSCDGGSPLAVSVESGQFTPAEPKLELSLSGSVRAWLCKPIKTALSPTVPVVLRATVSVTVAERHTIALDVGNVRIDMEDAGRLGPARSLAEQALKGLGSKLQADVHRDLASKRLVLDDILSPATVSKVEVKFVGTALLIEVDGELPKAEAAALLTKLAEKAHTP